MQIRLMRGFFATQPSHKRKTQVYKEEIACSGKTGKGKKGEKAIIVCLFLLKSSRRFVKG